MIRSKILNVLVALLGALFLAILAIAIVEGDGADSFAAILFAVLGCWCLIGAIRNLRGGAVQPDSLPTYTAAKWNTLAIAALLPSCVIFNIYKDQLIGMGVPETLMISICVAFGISLLAVPVVLLAHRITKGANRERSARTPSGVGVVRRNFA